MSEPSTPAVDASVPQSRIPESYKLHAAQMQALPAATLQPINIEIPFAVTAMLGSIPEIMALQPRLAKLPEFDIQAVDQMESCTLAMGYADTMYTMSTKKPEELPALLEAGSRKIAILRSDLKTLALRGIIDGAPLEQLRGGTSHRNIAFDLFALAYLARSNWHLIQGKTALTLAEITEAEQQADGLTVALGLRQQAPNADAPSADMRLRAFNLFWRNYKEVLRGVRFLEPEKFEDIMPVIHTPRGPSKKRGEEERPAPANTGVHPAVQVAGKDQPEAEAEGTPIAVGMPGASPYTKG